MTRALTLFAGWLLLADDVGAQPPPAPPRPAANPITETVKGFSYYGGWLLAAFDSIPANQYGFRPTPAQQTVGHIAQHLETANYELCGRFGGPPRRVTAADSLPEPVKAAWPKDTLVARLRRSLLYCRDAVETLSDVRLAETLAAGGRARRAGRRRAPASCYCSSPTWRTTTARSRTTCGRSGSFRRPRSRRPLHGEWPPAGPAPAPCRLTNRCRGRPVDGSALRLQRLRRVAVKLGREVVT